MGATGREIANFVGGEAIDGYGAGMAASWDESFYDAQSAAWQNIIGTPVFSVNDKRSYQQPESAATAIIRVRLIGPESAPAITTTTLPGSMTITDQKLSSLSDASRSKHSFDGRYTEESVGTKIPSDTVFSANTTVYAHWTYTGGGGGGCNPPVACYTLRFETGGGVRKNRCKSSKSKQAHL